MSEFKLIEEIVAQSEANNWDEAKREWSLSEVYREDEPLTCLCGHYPINEICVLRNTRNGCRTIVGNVCVKKFLGLPSDLIFQGLRRVSDDVTNALNADAILHANERRWINDWEKGFYLDTWRKRKLSDKQRRKRVQINEKVLRKTTNVFKMRAQR